MMVGFELPDNFRRPYGAIGFSDFWRRWHISLSTWLRDYLYISLGGNRRGPVRTYVNLALTMLLGGLWHGAAWRFVVWGGLHGLYLVVERALRPVLALGRWTRTRPARLLAGALTFALVCVAWVFFRAADFDAAMRLVGAMFGAGEQASRMHAEYYPALGVVGLLLLSHGLGRNTSWEQLGARLNPYVTAALLAVMLFFICISSDSRAFIYFQF
jgi:alginate O-acetyltransferase complex protein AlgI